MVSVAVSKLGCSPLFFVKPGAKVDGRCYWDVLQKQYMLPVIHRIAGTCSSRIAPQLFILATLSSYCSRRLEFIAPYLWKPSSPDVNQVDFCVWCLMHERICKTAVRDTADLKQRIIETWSGIPQTVIDETALFRATKCYHTTTGSLESHPHFIEENSYAFAC